MQDPSSHQGIHDLDGVDFDPRVLARQVGDEPGILAELFALYAETCRTATAELRQAIEVEDRKTAHRHAHKLASSSNSVGAVALGALCERIEAQANSAAHTQLLAFAAALEQESARALSWIEGMAANYRERPDLDRGAPPVSG